jgi:integrase/recombinase XerD
MGNPSRVRVVGPLVPYVAGFRADLEAAGYRRNAVSNQLQLLAHVSRWLASEGLGAGDLTAERVEEFLAARRAAGYRLWCSLKGVAPLLAHLDRAGVLPMRAPAAASTPAEALLERYRVYLVEERGLAAGTVGGYVHVAGLFLATYQSRIFPRMWKQCWRAFCHSCPPRIARAEFVR